MEAAYCDFPFEVPIYGLYGPSHAHALVSVPIFADKSKPLPVIVLLEGRAQLYEQDDSGRSQFDDGIKDFILITPKIYDDCKSALLSRTNSQDEWRFAEDALFLLVQESLFEIERRFHLGKIDFSRLYCTGYSMGSDSCFGLAAQPGVGRLLAGLVPFACKGDESMVFTSAGLDELKGLRIWGLQNSTERNDWKMHWMVRTLAKLVDGEEAIGSGEHSSEWESIPFEAPWLDGDGHVYKYMYGQKEVWEIADSQSSTWTERGLRFKHHNCWTHVMKYGLLDRFVTGWMLKGSNPNVDVAGELSYKLILRRPVCKCLANTRGVGVNEVPWEHVETTRCTAQRLGIWASPEGVVGANISWRDAGAPIHGKSVWVGDNIVNWKTEGRHVHLQFHRGKHLSWKPSQIQQTFAGATCTAASDADFHKWFPSYEAAKQVCFQQRCLGNFEVAIRWNEASFVDVSKKPATIEAESTEAETSDESALRSTDPRLQFQASRDKRAFLASPYWTSMLCHGALDNLLAEYKCKLVDCTDIRTKAATLRQAAKNKYVQEEFHEQPWRWVRRIQRVLRDARQPWLQMSVVNDRTGLDKAGVPITKKRIAKIEETDKSCDLFCFVEDAQYWTSKCEDGSKVQKELFVGLKSEVAKRFPDKYKMWMRPERTQAGAQRFCKLCWESEKRKSLARTHDVDFCKFASKDARCAAREAM
jgi:hypothetical protein